MATYFNAVNRNKRSLVLDLTEIPATSPVPASWSAAPTSSSRTSGPEPWRNWDWATRTWCAIRPDLYLPLDHRSRPRRRCRAPGYDLLVQAVGGLMSITGTELGDPTKAGVVMVDVPPACTR